MGTGNFDLTTEKLDECRIPSPLNGEKYASDVGHVLYRCIDPDGRLRERPMPALAAVDRQGVRSARRRNP